MPLLATARCAVLQSGAVAVALAIAVPAFAQQQAPSTQELLDQIKLLQKRIEQLFPLTAHVQIAGNPDRNEPDIGEANHLYLLDVLDRLGYQGYVGLEYKPKTTTGAGLGWAKKYGIKA